MNGMWLVALAIAVYLVAVLVFNNPFQDEEVRKEKARRRWAARVQKSAREHRPQ